MAADVRIANLLALLRTDSLNTLFTWITLLGKSQVMLCFIAVTTALIWLKGPKRHIVAFYTCVIGSKAFTYLGKLAFHRTRPEAALYLEHSYSFPSGHATIAASFYGFLAYLLIRSAESWKTKVNLFFTALVIIAAIGLSRNYLGVHYLSDVWCGYLISSMWLIIAITLAEWLGQQNWFNRPCPRIPGVRPISFCLVGGAVLFYILFGLHYNPPLAPKTTAKTFKVEAATDIFASAQTKYTESLLGERQEPVNFLFLAANDTQLTAALRKAGWVKANQANLHSLLQTAKALILLSISDIAKSLENNSGPKNSADFIVDLTDRLTVRMAGTIEDLDDKLAIIKEELIQSSSLELRQKLTTIRRESIMLRRYLSPQREALTRLTATKIPWLGETDRIRLREVSDKLIRYVEDLLRLHNPLLAFMTALPSAPAWLSVWRIP